MASTSGEDCLDLEDLAAFADGRLTGAERERAVKHLADCERCYEIFAEVVQLQEQEEGEEEAQSRPAGDAESDTRLAEVVVHPRSRSWLWPSVGGAVAAAALVVLVAAPLLRPDPRPPPDTGWDDHDWLILRSVVVVPSLSLEARAFRLGVRSIDLAVALEAGRARRARELSARLENLVRSLEDSTGARGLLQDLRSQLSVAPQAETPNGLPAGLIRQAKRVARLLEDNASPPPYFALGRWVEEGRAAALVGDHRYFESRRTRRFLRELKSFEQSPETHGELSEELARELDKVRSLIAEEPTGDELEQLEEVLALIVKLAGAR